MLHPVGDLPAAVYWRRRALVLVALLAVLGGVSWLVLGVTSRADDGTVAPATSSAPSAPATAAGTPALERLLPSLAAVRTPGPDERTTVAPPEEQAAADAPAAPQAGGPCTDDMLGLEVRTPGTVASGDQPTFELVVTNTSPVPCVRPLDAELQELVLLDGAGNRLWGSNDCFPSTSDDVRTLAPGEAVASPLVWGGLTSEPTCTAPRQPPAPGNYVVRGRLDTKTTPDAPLTVQ